MGVQLRRKPHSGNQVVWMKRSVPSPLTAFFLLAEGLIYAAFLALDLCARQGDTLPVKYAGILLCLLFALLRGSRRIAAALAFTAAADWFLLIRGDHLIFGVALFLCVQTLYALHLCRSGSSPALLLRAGAALAAVLLVILSDLVTPLNLLALIYFSQLAVNAALAWRRRGLRLFALGLTLFIGCDLCVGLYNILPADSALFPFASIGMWLFYLPSQVLIALSPLSERSAFHEAK